MSSVWVVVTEGGGDTVDTVDPYEFIDPVEILSKLPADFYEKMVIFIFLCLFFIKVLTVCWINKLNLSLKVLPLFVTMNCPK